MTCPARLLPAFRARDHLGDPTGSGTPTCCTPTNAAGPRRPSSSIAVARLGFDEVFRRMWDFYLCYSEAGFRAGYIDVSQLTLARG